MQECKNVLEVLYHHAKFGGVRISPTAGAAKNAEFLSHHTVVWGILSLLCVILFVCLFVCHFLFVSLYGYEFLSGGKS